MFGKKQVKKEEPAPVAAPTVPETPDLVVNRPENMGMPGFTSDEPPKTMPDKTATGIPGFDSIGAPIQEQAPAVTPAPAPAPAPAPVAAPVAPTPAPVAPAPKDQYQIVAAEIMPDGLYRYVIVTNKNLGEVGGVYEA